MFEMLGLNPQNHLKFLNQQQLKLQILNLLPWRKAKMVETRSHYWEKTLKHQVKENNILSLKKNPIRRVNGIFFNHECKTTF
jgi:hypothetical protein